MTNWHRFSDADVEIEHQEPKFEGFFTVFNYKLRHKLFAGGWSNWIQREVLDRGHAVAMLPYDPIRREFVMIEQFRVGALPTSKKPWLLEIVAGMIDAGETPEDVCLREAEEEAGLKVDALLPLTDYLPSPGGTTERLYLYLGIVNAESAQGIHGLDDEDEDILVHRIAEAQVKQLLNAGEFDNSATIIALQWFFLNKQELLEKLPAHKV